MGMRRRRCRYLAMGRFGPTRRPEPTMSYEEYDPDVSRRERVRELGLSGAGGTTRCRGRVLMSAGVAGMASDVDALVLALARLAGAAAASGVRVRHGGAAGRWRTRRVR